MARIVVDVMLKPEILDPQGKAIAHELPRIGLNSFTDVRQGKRFELTVEAKLLKSILRRHAKRQKSCSQIPSLKTL